MPGLAFIGEAEVEVPLSAGGASDIVLYRLSVMIFDDDGHANSNTSN